MLRALLVTAAILVGGAAVLPACSTPCDADRICTIDGEGQMCDGHSFVACGAANAGERVRCGRATRVGVCTPGGWTYQTSP